MTRNQPKDILSRVADLGEEALNKLPSFPGGDRLQEVVNQSRTRVDEMQKRLLGLDVLEQRVDDLEERLAKLEGHSPSLPAAPAQTGTGPAGTGQAGTAPTTPPA